ncbi:TolC family outer membrane protein [Sulfitobacter sp. D35]|uniref:TolC family outer membrane protein n=1 Tax=Sulfitobacter sp. D35 TaxID=3083252 RepID=UPI00296F0B91|nr:TolC family outer membrane protein [Sulfitobacter sp. D35]MDW4497123.1 TolC family outer membrane protein [Sulfitobacter sp. D35]
MKAVTRGRGLRRTVTAVLFGTLAAWTPVRADTLADALVGAYINSGLLDQNRALLRAADEDVAGATALLRPILNWSADLTRDFGDTLTSNDFQTRGLEATTAAINLTLDMLLWDNGATRLGVDVAKETVLATRQNLVSVEQQVLFRAVQAFMDLRAAIEFVDVRQNNLRLLTEELRAAQDRFEVGEVTRTDVALAEAAQAQARSGLAQAQGNLISAREEYRNAVGREPGRVEVPPSIPNLEGNVEAAKAGALRVHPNIRAAQHQVAAAELAILRAKAQISPSLRGGGRLGYSERVDSDAFTRGGSIGLNLSGPIYQGGALASNVRRAMALRDSERANLYTVQLDVAQNVGTAYAELAAARASVAAAERGIEASTIAFEGVREEATLGARTTLDVLNAEQDLLDAVNTRIEVQTQLYVAAYGVLAATGQLTVRDLRLNLPQYDPAAYYNLAKDAPVRKSKHGQALDRVLESLQKR